MSNTSIYKPTYLYIKQHSITGLKYFGKTVSKDPHKYIGSGKRWKNHINKHGKEHVVTLWYLKFYDKDHLQEFALTFSKLNNIVESSEWANLIPENGISGHVAGIPGYNKDRVFSDDHKAKLSAARKNRVFSSKTKEKMSNSQKNRSNETNIKISNALKNRIFSDEHKRKISDSKKGIPLSDKHKEKISLSLTGRKLPEETKAKMCGPRGPHIIADDVNV